MKRTAAKRQTWKPIILSAISVLLVLTIALNGGCLYFARVLDVYVGLGEQIITQIPGSENWDTEYYANDYPSAEECDAAAKAVTQSIAEEGVTLLKNSGSVLPLTTNDGSTSISLFGRRSVDTVYGGTGSGAGDKSQCNSMPDAFSAAGYSVNPTLADLYTSNLDKVPVAENSMDKMSGRTYYIGEFPSSYYTASVTDSYSSYSDAAIVVLGRQGGEGMDFSTDLKASISGGQTAMSADVAETKQYADGQHQLELSREEQDLIQHVTERFEKVIVLINSANVMEIDALKRNDAIDAILWMSYPGSRGLEGLANVLKGAVSPSGHTVNTWMTDMTADPAFQNAIAQPYSNVNSTNALADSYTMDYEEGIYVGYRYYETVYRDGGTFTVEGQPGKSYEEAVSYPFGYGLSYATFAQSIQDVTVAEDGKITVTVTVKNTQPAGGSSGKDVVQLYYQAPYDGTVEKSALVLGAFDKTEELAPGAEAEVVLTMNREDMASYDYLGQQCYVLAPGDYTLSLRKNAHELYGEGCEYVLTVAEELLYDDGNPRTTEVDAQTGEYVNLSAEHKQSAAVQSATNRFDFLSQRFTDYKNAVSGQPVNFTRTDFAASFPTAPTKEDLVASDDVISDLGPYTPDYYSSADTMPVTGATNDINAISLRGAGYDDPRWETLLDRLTPKQMAEFIYAGNQGTAAINTINLPATTSTDGPAGLKQYGGLGFSSSGNFNCSSTLLAATWNVALAEAYGVSVGNEALLAGKTGWYAPGLDMHRTPFGGRNFEYYSEDPVISGMMCAYTVQGCARKGLNCYFKHFALNESETHRVDNGFCVWVNEQALREIYLKAYELAFKTPTVELKYLNDSGETQYKTVRAANAVMSSFNRVGSVWAGACDALMQDVLRGEWGFLGSVITDYNSSTFMHVEQGVSNGNDLMLANASTLPTRFADVNNPSTVKVMRQAVKNSIYTIVNSNAVNGKSSSTVISYGISPWKIWLAAVDVVMVLIITALTVVYIIKKRRINRQAEIVVVD